MAGTVRDGQGAVIPGATIELVSPRRNDTQTMIANAEGDFEFLNLLPDTYTIKVTMDGFKTAERHNVVLNANDRLAIGVMTLELGAVTETVTVSSRVVEVQSRSAERSFSVDSTAITNLAVNGRSPLALTRLAPGIANAPADGSNLFFNVNGSRGGVHNLTVDGVSNMDTGSNGVSGNIKIRVDAFNALNHTQFNDVNATIQWQSMTNLIPVNLPYNAAGVLTNPTGFGTVMSVRPARVVQLLVRFDF
jgi:Carboxypeptidase regulatory-like domain